MWVEPDTNITSGESLIRQFVYGKKFFKEESENNPYLLISFLKDTIKDNIISFTYIRNAKWKKV